MKRTSPCINLHRSLIPTLEQSISRPSSRRLRVFNACLLSFSILTTPLAPTLGLIDRASAADVNISGLTITYGSSNVGKGRSETLLERLEAYSSAQPPGPLTPLAPNITATLQDAFTDNNASGRADPGSTLTYTATIINNGNADATGVQFTDTIDPNTTLVNGSVKGSPLAFADNYTATQNTRPYDNASLR